MINRRQWLQGAALAALVPGAAISRATVASAVSAWRAGPALPFATQEIYPAAHRGRLYVAGGIGRRLGVPVFNDACASLALDYADSGTPWRAEAELPDSRHHGQLASLAGKLWLFGGFTGSLSGGVWRMRDSVHTLAEDGWQPRFKLPKPRAEGVAAERSGSLHLVSGQSPKGESNRSRSDHVEVTDHWHFDAAEQRWRDLAPIPTARNSACGGWLGDDLVVTGGRTSEGNLSVTEIYDAREDRWRTAAPLPLPQAGTAAGVVGGSLYVFGGEIFQPEAKVFAQVWRYDGALDAWFAEPSMPTPRHGLGAVVSDDQILLIGGATQPSASGTSDVVEVFTPVG
ncbi:MAG: hypothetical protein NXH85_01770 [Pseudomonadaceae bacterium]|nr:hypothetical protein [Pseudomonadaceae bacterium]